MSFDHIILRVCIQKQSIPSHIYCCIDSNTSNNIIRILTESDQDRNVRLKLGGKTHTASINPALDHVSIAKRNFRFRVNSIVCWRQLITASLNIFHRKKNYKQLSCGSC